jgi:hypothetical protein
VQPLAEPELESAPEPEPQPEELEPVPKLEPEPEQVEPEPEDEEGQLDWPCALLMTVRGELWTVASRRQRWPGSAR